MKFKTGKKAVLAGYSKVVCVGYCDLQHLLNYHSPIAYTIRREGWATDVYDFNNIAIVTGYASFGNVRPDYDMLKRYDDAAQEIILTRKFLDIDKPKMVDDLIYRFLHELIEFEE